MKLLKSLSLKKYRENTNLFIIEGKKLVENYLTDNYLLKEIFISGDFKLSDLLKNLCLKNNVRINIIPKKELQKFTETKNSQNIIGVAEKIILRIEEVKLKNNFKGIICDEVRDPGNLGNILRTAKAFGITNIFLTENNVDVFNPKTVRAAATSYTSMNFVFANKTSIISFCKKNKINIIITSSHFGSELYNFVFPKNYALVISNEAYGVNSQFVKDSLALKIPLKNKVESLNVATALGIILYYQQKNL